VGDAYLHKIRSRSREFCISLGSRSEGDLHAPPFPSISFRKISQTMTLKPRRCQGRKKGGGGERPDIDICLGPTFISDVPESRSGSQILVIVICVDDCCTV